MNKKELVVNEKRISLYGSKDIIEKETPIIENLELTGNESRDRLLIQKCIDENKLKSDILYDGNTVYPFEKTVKEYRKLQKTDSLCMNFFQMPVEILHIMTLMDIELIIIIL